MPAIRAGYWRAALVAVAGFALAGANAGRPAPAHRCLAGNARIAVPAGIVLLGEDGPQRPGRKVSVAAFRIDQHEVTNRQFAAFVAATGYRTQAEREGQSAVFAAPAMPVALNDASRWWHFVQGADWRHPHGPASDLIGRGDEPVLHVSRDDAEAYARWAGGTLPSEAQWERAARGSQKVPIDPAKWAFTSRGQPRANVWEGVFPQRDTGEDGYVGIAPVGCFAANDLGLVDMVGNVWEWTSSGRGDGDGSRGLVKGGSYLCAMNYCANFRPAAFQAQEADLPTSHIGFRVAYDLPRTAQGRQRRSAAPLSALHE